MSAEVVSIDRPRCPFHKTALAHSEEDGDFDRYGWHCPRDDCPTFVPDEGGGW